MPCSSLYLGIATRRPELPAVATILVVEYGRALPSPSRWQVAVVTLPYFDAVRLALGSRAERTTYGFKERSKPAWNPLDRPFRARLVDAG